MGEKNWRAFISFDCHRNCILDFLILDPLMKKMNNGHVLQVTRTRNLWGFSMRISKMY